MTDWADERAVEFVSMLMREADPGIDPDWDAAPGIGGDDLGARIAALIREARAKGIEEAAAQLLDKAAIYRQLDGHMSLVRHFENEAEAIRKLKEQP